jgi:hypothetical protein
MSHLTGECSHQDKLGRLLVTKHKNLNSLEQERFLCSSTSTASFVVLQFFSTLSSFQNIDQRNKYHLEYHQLPYRWQIKHPKTPTWKEALSLLITCKCLKQVKCPHLVPRATPITVPEEGLKPCH